MKQKSTEITNKGKGKWKLLPGTKGQAHTSTRKLYRDISTGTAVFLNQKRAIEKDGRASRNISIQLVCACPFVISSIPGKEFSLSFPLIWDFDNKVVMLCQMAACYVKWQIMETVRSTSSWYINPKRKYWIGHMGLNSWETIIRLESMGSVEKGPPMNNLEKKKTVKLEVLRCGKTWKQVKKQLTGNRKVCKTFSAPLCSSYKWKELMIIPIRKPG